MKTIILATLITSSTLVLSSCATDTTYVSPGYNNYTVGYGGYGGYRPYYGGYRNYYGYSGYRANYWPRTYYGGHGAYSGFARRGGFHR